jgi:MFS family permease
MAGKRLFPENASHHKKLIGALFIDALGTGLFLPFSLLFFTATTSLSLTQIGLALSIAAAVRIPATIAAGPLSDRFSPRTAVVASQLLQAVGFVSYLFVRDFWFLVAAAIVLQIGNSIFWVAYPSLIFTVAQAGDRERWFALSTALRTAGVAAGGLVAGATVAFGGRSGLLGVAVANAASFLLAAFLVATTRLSAAASDQEAEPKAESERSWKVLLRDYPFLGFVGVNLGFTFLALASDLALPVFLVNNLHLPAWAPGAALALNAILATVATPIVMAAITGRRRHHVLMISQTFMIVGFALFLPVGLLPTAAAIAVVFVAILPLTACEMMQAAVVPAVVTESATSGTLGRYMSAYQLTFSIGDIITPIVVTAALSVGAAALWLPLAGVALLDLVVIGMLARWLGALPRRVAEAPAESSTSSARLAESEAL